MARFEGRVMFTSMYIYTWAYMYIHTCSDGTTEFEWHLLAYCDCGGVALSYGTLQLSTRNTPRPLLVGHACMYPVRRGHPASAGLGRELTGPRQACNASESKEHSLPEFCQGLIVQTDTPGRQVPPKFSLDLHPSRRNVN